MFEDVRMRGFRRRTDVDAAQAWVDGLPVEPRVETVALQAAHGRVLAAPLVSEIDVPAFPRAAMDGWALRGAETFGASASDPLQLAVVGTSLPGSPHTGALRPGQAVRIMTGAPVPDEADTVLRAEDGHQEGATLTVRAPAPTGRHVGAVAEDIARGTEVLPTGRTLRPQDLGVASSIGRAALPVFAAPSVTLLVTGDELLPAGARPDGFRIADANSPMLRALVERDGGAIDGPTLLRDDEEALRCALAGAAGDLVLVTGGSSVGQEDHAPRLLHRLGELAIHGVALRPAAPAGMGRIGARPAFLLPGNPVSCLCAYDFFAGRLVRRLAGRDPTAPYACVRGTLTRKIASVLGRVDYVRVRCAEGAVTPVMSRGASILSSTTEADGFVLVPRDHEGWPEGTEVEVRLYGVLRS